MGRTTHANALTTREVSREGTLGRTLGHTKRRVHARKKKSGRGTSDAGGRLRDALFREVAGLATYTAELQKGAVGTCAFPLCRYTRASSPRTLASASKQAR